MAAYAHSPRSRENSKNADAADRARVPECKAENRHRGKARPIQKAHAYPDINENRLLLDVAHHTSNGATGCAQQTKMIKCGRQPWPRPPNSIMKPISNATRGDA